MNRSVQLYIEGQRIELFNDETINVTSSIQNVQDLSKTYTDFSQGFTVPASSHNNAIFEHWYQSDVNATSDPNLRKDGFIEIDLTTFRKGKIQLDGAVITNGKASAYKITFYGEGVTLKDLFGEDLLSDLDFTALSHDFTSTEIINRIEDNTNAYDVKWPLITSNRIWEYQSTPVNVPLPNWLTSTATNNDIHTTSGAIDKEELFPAVRATRIIQAIASKYGISFQGTFLTDDRFRNLFLWFKNKENYITSSVAQDIDFTAKTPVYAEYDLSPYVDLTTNEITVEFIDLLVYQHIITFTTTSTTSSATYYVDIYQNGNLINTIASLGTGIGTGDIANVLNVSGLNEKYTLKIRSEEANTITLSVKYAVTYVSGGALLTDYINMTCSNIVFSVPNVNLSANAPQIKVADFLKGIMLMFNMTIYSVKDNEYWLEPLDDWYSKGAVIDISQYTDVTSIEMERMPLYKKIQFKYQDSDCFLNKYFSQTFNRNYGDTTYQYNYDGGEFVIEVPFENLLQTKFNGTQELQLGYSLNSSFSPYVPKPVLLYQYDNQVCDFKFVNDGGGHSTITTYTPFGQDLNYNGDDITLNFAPETSTLLNYPIQNTTFSQYYFSYLYNLYNLKQRLVKVKTNLPTSLITGLQLNDRLVIRDKRYIINEMQSNLNTGDVNFELILDFRPIVNSTQPIPKVSILGGQVQLPVLMQKSAMQVDLYSSIADVTFSENPVYEQKTVTVTIPAEQLQVYLVTENGNMIATEDRNELTTEGAVNRVIDVRLVTTYADGTSSTEIVYIIQG